ncbi:MAG: molybdenum cofactor guanylyltransferase [Chloroflexota bacterium]
MKLSVVVQAGGESKRMGSNKALLPFLGQPLIVRVIERIKPIAEEILITTNQPQDLTFLHLPLYSDILPGFGALGGLLTALTVSTSPLTAVVACDMPFVSPELLSYQAQLLEKEEWDAVIPKGEQGFEPFHGVFRTTTCRWAVQQVIDKGEKKVIAWFPLVRVRFVEGDDLNRFDPLGYIFMNVNTPGEFETAERLAQTERD